jgi:hypothetical protein
MGGGRARAKALLESSARGTSTSGPAEVKVRIPTAAPWGTCTLSNKLGLDPPGRTFLATAAHGLRPDSRACLNSA